MTEVQVTGRLLLTVPEAAAELRVSEATAWRLVGRGVLPSVKVGGSRRVRRADLETWIARLAG